MIQHLLKRNLRRSSLCTDGSDHDFDSIYPLRIRRMADQHFTPLHVAKTAALFLAPTPGTKVLDIGSGAGKFCLIGAVTTQGHFVGVEQRTELVSLSSRIASACRIPNVRFIHANIMTVCFSEYDSFYLFNPFYENAANGKPMDNEVLMSPSLFASYSSYTAGQLDQMRAGTRLATYYTSASLIPNSFRLVESMYDGRLRHWEKRQTESGS